MEPALSGREDDVCVWGGGGRRGKQDRVAVAAAGRLWERRPSDSRRMSCESPQLAFSPDSCGPGAAWPGRWSCHAPRLAVPAQLPHA